MAETLAKTPSSLPSLSEASRKRTRRLVIGGLAMILVPLVVAIAVNVLFVVALPWQFQVSVDGTIADLPPDTPITITTEGLGGRIVDAALYASRRSLDGAFAPEQKIPVEWVSVGDRTGWGTSTTLQLQQVDGSNPLDYDSRYRLHLTVETKAFAVPLPKNVISTQEYTFGTLTTPQLAAQEGVIALRYEEPIVTRWSAPIASFRVEVNPSVEVETWIDPADRTAGYVRLKNPDQGRRYEITVTEAWGTNGAPLRLPAHATVETPAPPRPLVDEVQLEGGNRIVLRWEQGIANFDYEITPTVESVAEIDPDDPRVSYITLRGYQQQQEYRVHIRSATSQRGAPLTAAADFTVVTPPPVEVTDVSPGDGAFGIGLSTPIRITFDREILDRAAAEAAIAIEPAIVGRFEWVEPNQVQFVPEQPLPPFTDVNVAIAGGPDRVRGTDGGYLGEPFAFSFLTQPNKLISVDLTRQRLTLLEDGQPVFTTLVSTGVRGGETPTGNFMVQYKMPSARFRGVNPSGSRYDIPNVPWVLAFYGDYTIHGSPWRTRFGFPQSAGCVSMSARDSKIVYDWAPVGTPIYIHY